MSINYTSRLVSDKIVEEQIEVKDLNEKTNIMPEELLINMVGEEVVQQ